MPVSSTRTEYDALLPKWKLIRDCLSGQEAVKREGDRYLPRPAPSDTSEANRIRYHQYLERAVFYNVTGRTISGLQGQVFRKPPMIELPPEIEALQANVDGAGVSLVQQAIRVVRDCIAYSRSGLWVDYPQTGGPLTREQILRGDFRPNILRYDPWDIINWRQRKIGGVMKLSLVVMCEQNVTDDDGYEEEFSTMWRELRLDESDLYVVREWVEQVNKATNEKEMVLLNEYLPTDASGNRLDYIPFTFVGSINNDPTPDPPLAYDLAELNISHYHNSADYEESVFWTGQPTLALAGLTEDWVNDVLKGRVQLGSRAAIFLPEGGSASLLQPSPNILPAEAMRMKEDQMISIGAKLVEKAGRVERTATEVVIKDFGEHANLTTVSQNVSSAYVTALGFALKFVTPSDREIKVELNTEFEVNRMNANEVAQVIASWQSGAITLSEMRANLIKGGYAKLPMNEYEEERESEKDLNLVLLDAPAGADQNLRQEGAP